MTTLEPEIILGTAQLTARYGVMGVDARSDQEALEILATAWESGIRTVDTAPAYGRSEDVIGTFDWSGAIHTKITRDDEPTTSLAASLVRLGVSEVDVLYLHDARAAIERPGSLETARTLVGRGTRRIGASVYEVEEFVAAVEHPAVDVVQVPMNVLDRRFTGPLLEAARSGGVAVYARSVFLQGVLLPSPHRLPEAVEFLAPWVASVHRIAAAHGVPSSALLLAWVRQQGVDGILLGASTSHELRSSIESWKESVPPEALAEVDGLEPPCWQDVDPRRWRTT